MSARDKFLSGCLWTVIVVCTLTFWIGAALFGYAWFRGG